jgi:hypothetical protein
MLAPAGPRRNTETREAKIPLVQMKVTAATFAGLESPSSELSSKVQVLTVSQFIVFVDHAGTYTFWSQQCINFNHMWLCGWLWQEFE